MFELPYPARKVTQLEVLRLALGYKKRPGLANAIESCCDEGGGINSKTILRYERRLNYMFDLFERAFCKYFQVASVAFLGLGIGFEAARWWTWMTEEELEEEMLHRRKMLRSMGMAGIWGATGLLLPVPDLVANAQDLDGLHEIGDGAVGDARRTATNLAIAYAANPGGDTVRAANAHALTLLDVLTPGRATMGPSTRAQLQAVASDAASLAGYADMNAGLLDRADRWFQSALELAREAGDRRLEALALTGLATIHPAHANCGPTPSKPAIAQAVSDLEVAATFSTILPPSGRAWVWAYLAEQHAVLGEDLVSGRFLEHARTAAAAVRWEEPGWGWWSKQAQLSGWDGTRPEVFAAGRLLDLGRATEALELYDGALAGVTVPSRRAQMQVNLAYSCVALGDADRACASAHSALDEIQAHRLGRFLWKVQKACSAFPTAWNGRADVRELAERLRIAA